MLRAIQLQDLSYTSQKSIGLGLHLAPFAFGPYVPNHSHEFV